MPEQDGVRGDPSIETEGREISRRVVASISAAAEQPWLHAVAWQERNPDVKAAALRGSEDPAAAWEAMVPFLALFHPNLLRYHVAHCRAVVAELGHADPVPPLEYNRVVETEPEWGGQQQHDRLAQLEDQFERIEALLARLLMEPDARARLRASLPPDPSDVQGP